MKALTKSLLAAAALAMPASALADVVASDCDWLSDMRVIVEPWQENSRTFYNGDVRIALGDSTEPACCAIHVLILMPDPDNELGERKCVVVNRGGGMGFSGVDFQALKSSYDPATGLTVSFPYSMWNPETNLMGPWKNATIRMNLATGDVTAR